MRIEGIVLDSRRRPLVDIAVRAALLESRRTSNTTTDARGQFTFEDLEAGRYEISVTPRFGTRDEKPVTTWADTGATGIELVLPVTRTFTGRVLVEGVPVTSVELQVGPDVGFPIFGWTKLRTTDGRFALDTGEASCTRMWICAPGSRHKAIDIAASSNVMTDIGEIVLERGDRICGHVRDANGVPIAGARVWIGRGIVDSMRRLPQLRAPDYDTTTDENGAYVFDGIDPHPPDIRPPNIWATHARTASLIRELPTEPGTIDLVLLETGRIVGRLERGLAHRKVIAIRADEPESARVATTTAVGGGFVFDELPPGDYVLSVPEYSSETNVSVRAHETSRTAIRVGDTLVELTIYFDGEPSRRPTLLERTDAPPSPPTRGRIARSMLMMMTGQPTCYRVTHEVEPGTYRFSADGETWTQIVVTATPLHQTVKISASSSKRKV